MAASGARRIANRKGRMGRRHGHFGKTARPNKMSGSFGNQHKRGRRR